MSDSYKKSQDGKRELFPLSHNSRVLGPEDVTWQYDSEEKRIAVEAWWQEILTGLETASTFLDKWRFLDKYLYESDLRDLDDQMEFELALESNT